MIVQLIVENVGLIEKADLAFSEGLQVITGETGVGKTMLLSSLGILRGERARSDLIRTGSDEAYVSGFFLVESKELQTRLEETLGRSFPDGEILIERRLRRTGRSRNLLNGQEVPLSLIRDCGNSLLEIHGQRTQLDLLEPRQQLDLLDRFAAVDEERAAFRTEYKAAQALARRIETIDRGSRERGERRVLLEHVVSELESASVEPGERGQLEKDLELLEERDRILQLVSGARAELQEDEGSLLDRLGHWIREFDALGDLSESLTEFSASCETARAALEDSVRALTQVESDTDQDPAHLETLRARYELLVQLEERYHRRGDELPKYLEKCRQELDDLVEEDEDRPALEVELRTRLDDLGQRARVLGKKRRTAARKLSKAVTGELKDLQMPDATFEVSVARLGSDDAWHGFDDAGGDQVEFMFGPNPGEDARPLRSTASGGELSRVMLSLKKALADTDDVPVLVFDEIDTGVGGRLGSQLGRKLQEIGATHQVLCVTHLPQIASFGRKHFRVRKEVLDGRTQTILEFLEDSKRPEEIAAMMRGEGRTEASLAEARHMLEEGGAAARALERGAIKIEAAAKEKSGAGKTKAGKRTAGRRVAKKKKATRSRPDGSVDEVSAKSK